MEELASDRVTVEDAIRRLKLLPVTFETFSAHPESARDLSLQEVRESDVFIQLVGKEVSSIVREEYDVAADSIPGGILVFLKEVPRVPDCEAYVRELKKKHVCKSYPSEVELRKDVEQAIGALTAEAFRHLIRTSKAGTEEVVVNESVELRTGQSVSWTFGVEDGDRIRGMIESADNFDVYVLSEREYADWRNNPGSIPPLRHEVSACYIDRIADRHEIWYLVVKLLAWIAPRTVSVKVRRLRRASTR